jgi:hypothetical protein
LDEKELKDLRMFGMGIEYTETNDQNKKNKTFDQPSYTSTPKKKNQNHSIEKLLSLFQKKITKYFYKTCKWFFTKIRNFYHIIRFWKFKRKLNSQGKKFDHSKIFYKIVETRKQRFNKIIITRRRVPYYYINDSVFSVLKPKKAIYFLSLKDDHQGGTFIKKTAHKGLDESVWDFPYHKKTKGFWDKKI